LFLKVLNADLNFGWLKALGPQGLTHPHQQHQGTKQNDFHPCNDKARGRMRDDVISCLHGQNQTQFSLPGLWSPHPPMVGAMPLLPGLEHLG
jgi:hypothetical protein